VVLLFIFGVASLTYLNELTYLLISRIFAVGGAYALISILSFIRFGILKKIKRQDLGKELSLSLKNFWDLLSGNGIFLFIFVHNLCNSRMSSSQTEQICLLF